MVSLSGLFHVFQTSKYEAGFFASHGVTVAARRYAVNHGWFAPVTGPGHAVGKVIRKLLCIGIWLRK